MMFFQILLLHLYVVCDVCVVYVCDMWGVHVSVWLWCMVCECTHARTHTHSCAERHGPGKMLRAVAAGADSCRICLLSLSPPRTAWCGSSQLPKHIPCNPGQAPGGQEWSSRKKPTIGNLEGSPGLPLKV